MRPVRAEGAANDHCGHFAPLPLLVCSAPSKGQLTHLKARILACF
jgi:hypothetical protein